MDNFPIALTFDIDWVPDYVLAECVDILSRYSIPATFFATHSSPLLTDISKESLFEVGIHPNFLVNSSHGNNELDVMRHVLNIVPGATTMRTHGLLQSSNLYYLILKNFPQIKIDTSIYLSGNNNCKPYKYYDEYGNYMIRLPFQWEDDLYFLEPPDQKVGNDFIFENGNYQIFNFHPIHVYLNSSNSKNYNLLINSLKCPLVNCIRKDMDIFINHATGTKNWLVSMLQSTDQNRYFTVTQIANYQKLFDIEDKVINSKKNDITSYENRV